jgi:hypothetical protein
MHAHRIAGEPDPSAVPPPWSDRVCGLGVCDALQLRLEPGQLPWLCDELEQLRVAHEQALGEATAARAANESRERALAGEDVERHRHELALVAAVRDRIAREDGDGRVIVCGPAPMLSAIVRGATRAVTEALAERADDRAAAQDADGGRRLLALARAADAWVHTLVALARLEWFTFELEPEHLVGDA